jgi:HEAT repeat protein
MGQSILRRTVVAAALLLLLGLPTARGQDAVESLRQILAVSEDGGPEGLEYRRTKVKEAVDRMKTIGQLRRALMLDEWKVDPNRVVNEQLRAADLELRRIVGERLKASIERMAAKGDANARLAIANLIAEMGPAVRAIDPADRNGYSRSLTDIVIKLTQDDDLGVRQEALRALGNINALPSKAAEVFKTTLQRDREVGPRRLAADGLQQLIKVVSFLQRRGQTASGVEAGRGDLYDTVLQVAPVAAIAVEDADSEVRTLALQAVQGAAQSLADMMEVPEGYSRKNFPQVGRKLTPLEKQRILASYELVKKDYDQVRPIIDAFRKAVPKYARGLYDSDNRVRLAATQAFENLGNARLRIVRRAASLPTLRDLKGNLEKSPQELLQGADFLDVFFAKDLGQIQVLLRDPEVRIRRAAAEVLEEFEEKSLPVLPGMIAATTDPDRFVRWTIAKAIGTLPPDQAGPAIVPLAGLLTDPDLNLRIAAATALEALGSNAKAAVPMLAESIRKGDVEARLAAMYALMKIGPEHNRQALPALILTLSAPDPRVSKTACEAIGEMGPAAAEALPALRRLLGNDDGEVRAWASDAILSILRAEEK